MTDFEKNIADQLDKVQYQAPVDAWENIARALDEKGGSSANPWKTRFFVAAALLLLTAGSIPLILMNQNVHPYIENTPNIVQPEQNLQTESSNLNTIQPNIENPNQIVQSTPQVIIKEVKVPVYIEKEKIINSSSYLNNNQQNTIYPSTEKIDKNDTNLFYESISLSEKESFKNSTETNKQQQLNEIINEENALANELFDQKIGKEEEDQITLPSNSFQPKVGINALVSNQFWGTFGDKSFISNMLDNYAISNNSTFSYGGRISIPLSEKLYIRSGLSWIQAQQNTADVPLYFGEDDYLGVNNDEVSIIYNSQIPFRIGSRAESNAALNEIGYNSKLLGNIEQQISWFEVPVEMEYRFLQRKNLYLGVTGGMSNYFLNKNNVLISTNFLDQTTFGEANNLNDYSYSLNGGVNLGFNLNQKFGVQVEPQFKYLLETFDDNRLQPYVFGLNFSVGYRF